LRILLVQLRIAVGRKSRTAANTTTGTPEKSRSF